MMRVQGILFTVLIALYGHKVFAENDGYILFCPCMGRFGNQVEQYLGTLQFAKALNRTLVLAPFLEYPFGEVKAKVVPFTNVFQVESLREFHRVITMEEFITDVAPNIWPKDKREVFCWTPRKSFTDDSTGCQAKEGNPFGPFWDYYGVDFVSNNYFNDIGYDVSDPDVINDWNKIFPVENYPVIAFSSAPADFPVRSRNRQIQSYLKWSKKILKEAESFVDLHLSRPFIGIHLRNNVDWEKACEHVDSESHFFASAQCTGDKFEFGKPSKEMCLPSEKQILIDVYREAQRIEAKTIFVSTDKNHMLQELNDVFNNTVDIRRLNKHDLYLSLAILDQADHLIANCMSTYSAFAVRQRQFFNSPYRPFSFFALHKAHAITEVVIDEAVIDENVKLNRRDEL